MDSNERPIILAIDTCSLPGSVSIFQGEHLVFERILDKDVSHSSTLLKTIDQGLRSIDTDVRDVSLFAASSGPGSFTGIRIGLATINALSRTTLKNSVGVPTLQAVAHSGGPSQKTLAMIPAGRGEVFAQVFSVNAEGEVLELTEPVHLPPEKVIDAFALEQTLHFAGTAADMYFDVFRTKAVANGVRAFEVDSHPELPVAAEPGWSFSTASYTLSTIVGRLAMRTLNNSEGLVQRDLLPDYVRPSDPELKLICR